MIDALVELFQGDLLSIFLKLFGIVLGFLYLFFAFIMVKQISAMKHAVTVKDNSLLTFLGYVQVALALLVVAFALVIL